MTVTTNRTPASGNSSRVSHFSTLRNNRTHRILWPSIIVGYVLPVAVGLGAWAIALRLGALEEIIGGLALMAGFLFALVIFVFELRLRVTSDPRTQSAIELPRLIDELFANVTYSVVIALSTTAVALAAAANQPQSENGHLLGIEPWLSAVLVALMVHLFAMILTCLRRTGTAYRELQN